MSRGGVKRIRPNERWYTQLLARPPVASSKAYNENWEQTFGKKTEEPRVEDDDFGDDDEQPKRKIKAPKPPPVPPGKKLWHDDDDRPPPEDDE